MSLLVKIKPLIATVPASVGRYLSALPYSIRLGKSYSSYKQSSGEAINNDKLFLDIKNIVEYSQKNIPFYKQHYQSMGFDSAELTSYEDIAKIPVICKADLQKMDIKTRFGEFTSGIITNTGGTSGQPLDLILDNQSYAREWAHMHRIWEQIGYKPSCMKFTFRGVNLGNTPVKYNFIHNEFQINAYSKFEDVVEEISKIICTYKIEFLHGYPSAIYEFIKQLSGRYPLVLDQLKTNLKGVFFGSEFPAPIYRSFIEQQLGVRTISWYGHTEMAVLAREIDEPFIYYPFHSYGFTEALKIDGKHHLLGTTIHNKVGPLIRYDTGDIVEPLSYKDGVLESFKISEGRLGEFVTDKKGRNISLTALIFGRHHDLFGQADFIQVKQRQSGLLRIYVTSTNKNLDCNKLFDSSGIDMDIHFELVDQPFKTKAGKTPLVVK